MRWECVETPGVNTITPARLLFSAGLFLALVVGASAGQKVTTVQTGERTYTTTVQASSAFNRDVDELKSEAQEAAAKYCASLGKQIKVLSVTGEKPFFGTGYPKGKVVFMALDAGDAALTAAVAPDGTLVAPPPPPREHVSPTGDLYNDLLKLDDLRKRGILTDEEFQSEKKKVLARSQ